MPKAKPNPLQETAESWPFPKPPQIAGSLFKRGGALYVWLYRHYEDVLKAQSGPVFAWRDVAYEAGKMICNPHVFQPPTPAQTAATWKKVIASVAHSGHDREKYADIKFPGEGGAREFPQLPPAPEVPPSAARVMAAVRQRSGGRFSPVYRWMRANYAELRKSFEDGSPNWNAVAVALAEAGLTDRDGNPPIAGTVSQTWYRVVKAMERKPVSPHPSVRMIEPAAAPDPPSAPAQPSTGNAAEKIRAFREGLKAGKVRIPEPINPAKRKPDGET